MAHFSPVLFPFVFIGVEHGMNRSPVLSTSLIDIFGVSRRWMRVYSVNHLPVLTKFGLVPVMSGFRQCLTSS